MKRLVVILALGLFAIALMTPVSAQFGADTPTSDRVETEAPAQLPGRLNQNTAPQGAGSPPNFGERPVERAETRELRQEVRQENREENREERQETLQEMRQERWGEVAQRLQQRLRWFDQRLSSILNRAFARAEIMSSAGTDVSEAQATLQNAERLLEDARADAAQAVSVIEALESSPDAESGLSEVNSAIRTAHESYKAVRLELLKAVRQLKSARGLVTETTGQEANE